MVVFMRHRDIQEPTRYMFTPCPFVVRVPKSDIRTLHAMAENMARK